MRLFHQALLHLLLVGGTGGIFSHYHASWNKNMRKTRSTGSGKVRGIFSKIIWWTHVLLWGHWYPCFGLMVTSSLDFKARVGRIICTWWSCMWCIFPEIHLWCHTCPPLASQHGSRWLFPTYVAQGILSLSECGNPVISLFAKWIYRTNYPDAVNTIRCLTRHRSSHSWRAKIGNYCSNLVQCWDLFSLVLQ